MLCASSFYKGAPMTQDSQPPRRNLKQVRILLWVLVALAVAGTAAILHRKTLPNPIVAYDTTPKGGALVKDTRSRSRPQIAIAGGSGARIRTSIRRSKVCSLTIRRPRNVPN